MKHSLRHANHAVALLTVILLVGGVFAVFIIRSQTQSSPTATTNNDSVTSESLESSDRKDPNTLTTDNPEPSSSQSELAQIGSLSSLEGQLQTFIAARYSGKTEQQIREDLQGMVTPKFIRTTTLQLAQDETEVEIEASADMSTLITEEFGEQTITSVEVEVRYANLGSVIELLTLEWSLEGDVWLITAEERTAFQPST